MSLECTKHMNEKDVYRNLSSLVTPKQQLKESFQTFVALLADEARHFTSQTRPVLKDELSDSSGRSGVIANELFKSLILRAVSLDDAVIDPWMATR